MRLNSGHLRENLVGSAVRRTLLAAALAAGGFFLIAALIYPAGTWVKGTTDVITLDAVYDSATLLTNEYTALFAEEGIALIQRCYDSYKVTVNTCTSGQTGAKDLETVAVPKEFLVWKGSPRDPSKGDPLVTFRYDQDFEFYDAIRNQRPCRPSFADGARAQAVMDAAVRSDAEGRWVDVPKVG